MSRLLTTRNLPDRDCLAYWADAVCDAYVQLDCDTPCRGESFYGEIRIDPFPGLVLSRVTSTAQRVMRTPARIARASEDFFLVSLQVSGRGLVEQDGRMALLQPGDFALYDSTRPYRLRFDGEFQQIVVMLPGGALRTRLQHAETLTARAVPGRRGAGPLMIRMIDTLTDRVATLDAGSAVAVSQGVEHILVAGLRGLSAPDDRPVSRLTALHRAQVRAFIGANLRDPRLSVSRIAAHLQLSVSTVHRVFAGEGLSVSEWIRAQRLEGARADLTEPRLARYSVSEIAYGWGFSDAAHFSRSFRARYGLSPSECRRGVRVDLCLPPA